jgi:hypothetical protein
MSRAPVPETAVLELARALAQRQAQHAFIGGLAINAWGIPRATFDIDVLVDPPEGNVAELMRGLALAGIEIDDAVLRGYLDPLSGMEKATGRLLAGGVWFTIDVFVATTPFLRSAIGRRATIELGSDRIEVVTAADLLLFKLVAGRRKDWVDIENIVTVQGIPEREYLEAWADRLGVRERLDKVLGRKPG